jgi:hypothetical protein
MAKIKNCPEYIHKEAHHCHHLEDAQITEPLDYRDCQAFDVVEATDLGCCELALDKKCPYLTEGASHIVRQKGDGEGRWNGEDFEIPWKVVLAELEDLENNALDKQG